MAHGAWTRIQCTESSNRQRNWTFHQHRPLLAFIASGKRYPDNYFLKHNEMPTVNNEFIAYHAEADNVMQVDNADGALVDNQSSS